MKGLGEPPELSVTLKVLAGQRGCRATFEEAHA